MWWCSYCCFCWYLSHTPRRTNEAEIYIKLYIPWKVYQKKRKKKRKHLNTNCKFINIKFAIKFGPRHAPTVAAQQQQRQQQQQQQLQLVNCCCSCCCCVFVHVVKCETRKPSSVCVLLFLLLLLLVLLWLLLLLLCSGFTACVFASHFYRSHVAGPSSSSPSPPTRRSFFLSLSAFCISLTLKNLCILYTFLQSNFNTQQIIQLHCHHWQSCVNVDSGLRRVQHPQKGSGGGQKEKQK